jgi:hypothetical protein
MIQLRFRPAAKCAFLDDEVKFTSYMTVPIRHTLKFHSASASVLVLFWNKTTNRTIMASKDCKWNKQGRQRQCTYSIKKCGVPAWLLLPWTHKNAFCLYCWHTYVADNNIINTESITREEQPCILCIVALHMSLSTIRNARTSTCKLR